MPEIMSLYDLVAQIVPTLHHTMSDVEDVKLDVPLVPRKITIIFTDGSEATVEIQRPTPIGSA